MKTNCRCQEPKRKAVKANLAKGIQYIKYEGRDFIVVPVILAKSNVVMNGGLLPESSMQAMHWNGSPVTIGHPTTAKGEPTSANDPKILEANCVGRMFNCKVDNGSLKGDAWIDVARANAISPGIIALIEGGDELDVSTGYFCEADEKAGEVGGQKYNEVHSNVVPDHLALLPGDVGACSWADGCGVRANKEKPMAKATSLLERILLNRKKPKKNARGSPDDSRQIISDLISSDDTPFMPDDAEGLSALSDDALKALRDSYLMAGEDEKSEPPEEKASEPKEAESSEGEETKKDDPPKKDVQMSKNAGAVSPLTAQDKEALAYANRVFAEHKAALVSRVVGNSKITKEQAEAMPVATLEVVANGLQTSAPDSFVGRAVPPVDNSKDEDIAGAMSGGLGVVHHFKKKA